MAVEHDLIMNKGLSDALREAQSGQERANLRVAADILEQSAERPEARSFLHSVLCTIYLPHRRTAPDAVWQRHNGDGATLMIQPTKDERGRYCGVPYGPTGRLMMIFLQNEAYRNRSRRVELGNSMHAWLRAMGVDNSGKGYKAAREQAMRIEQCLVSVAYETETTRERWQDTIIRGSFNIGEDRQPDLFAQAVELSESFYNALLQHPAVLFEPAIRHLAGKSLSLDVYVWLAYRLHVLARPTPISWRALHRAFGPNYARERDFRNRFRDALQNALLVYPEARVDVDEEGVILHASAPPAPPRSVVSLAGHKAHRRVAGRG
ncbi:MAG: pirin [Geminicoccaceae bacterium]|nr:pirin [Geminicoccaceae bacterium]MCB9946010.1 pirin [Geminicoccaceae bacterium]